MGDGVGRVVGEVKVAGETWREGVGAGCGAELSAEVDLLCREAD